MEKIHKSYINQEEFFPIIGAVLAGRQEGFVIADKDLKPTVILVVHKFGFAQIISNEEPVLVTEWILEITTWLKNNSVYKFAPISKLRIYDCKNQLIITNFKKSKFEISCAKRQKWRLSKLNYQHIADTHLPTN